MVALFDQMSSEYGWTDSQILNLPICRLRNVSDAIAARRKAEMQASAMLVEWSTKTISTFVAATVPTPKGKKNGLLKSAGDITLGLFGKGAGGKGGKGKLPPSADLNSLTEAEMDAIVNRPSMAQESQAEEQQKPVTTSAEAFQLQFGRHLGAPR